MKWLAAGALLAASPSWAQPPQNQPPPSQPAQTQSPPAQLQPSWLPRTTAELRLLEKVRAQSSTVEVKVGQSVAFGTLTIQLRSCVTRPPDQPADSAAFLAVADARESGKGFSGWILANTPAVSMFEDPIYDLRLVACR